MKHGWLLTVLVASWSCPAVAFISTMSIKPSSTSLFYTRPTADGKSSTKKKKKAKPPRYLTANTVEPRLNQVLRGDEQAAAVLDFNNIRGKDNFKLSSVACLQRISAWVAATKLEGRVVVVIDHGLEASAFEYQGLHLVFAGAGRTADDVIAALTRRLYTGQPDGQAGLNVVVATSDRELSGRCLAAGKGRRMAALRRETEAEISAESVDNSLGKPGSVQVVPSATLLNLVDWSFAQQNPSINIADTESKPEGLETPPSVSTIDQRIALVLAAERRFRKAGHFQDKRHFKKKALYNLGRAQRAAALASAPATPSDAVPEDVDEIDDEAVEEVAVEALTDLAPPFREASWHRVLSAEKLRLVFVDLPPLETSAATISGGEGASHGARGAGAAVVAECVRQQHETCPPVSIAALVDKKKPRVGKKSPAAGIDNSLTGAALHPLLGDHRLRGDPKQRAALRRFVMDDMKTLRGESYGEESNESNLKDEADEEASPAVVENGGSNEDEKGVVLSPGLNEAEPVTMATFDPPRHLSLARAKRAGRRARGEATAKKIKLGKSRLATNTRAKKELAPSGTSGDALGLAQEKDISAWLETW